jgi:transcription elongation factor Elf1
MPNTGRPLPVPCPKCQHAGCRLVVKSISVMTLTCARCDHTWATLIESLPPDIQDRVHAVLTEV